MSSSRSQEDTYEAQNDQRLDELHSKIRTLRGVSSRSHPHCAVILTTCRLPLTFTMTRNTRTWSSTRRSVSTLPPSLHAFATDPPGGARTAKDQYVQLRRIRFRSLRRPHDPRLLTEHNEDDTNRGWRPRIHIRFLVLQAPV